MDVYHKVLTKIYETSGGKETADVDLVELLKREGFYPSRDGIVSHLSSEGWVTITDRQYVVKITHWGVAEAKRAIKGIPDNNQTVVKDANRLLSGAREFVTFAEEFAASPSKDKLKSVSKRYSDLGEVLEQLRSNL